MRRFLIAGNWKMNLLGEASRSLAASIAQAMPAGREAIDVLIAPAFPYLLPVAETIQQSRVQLAAQNAYFENLGAFTGEVAAQMLRDVGCSHVILGHSERRHVLLEDDQTINQKVTAVLRQRLAVIFCVGETIAEREADQTHAVLDRQMSGGLAGVSEEEMARIVIAYEPVWAIGTGLTAQPDEAESAHAHLRKWLASHYNSAVADAARILYGGSVKPENAKALLNQPNVDGALVGGASLIAETFNGIIDVADELSAV